ncbi:MAG: bifunctional DNA-formamidopyrimidine glycosylase/DNA-(apurinic or apyrimidinic site) lyase [Patescibacteria group bacterium]
MPELPEVQTTVNGLNRTIVGLRIANVWSNYDSSYFKDSQTIKDPAYFVVFKKIVMGSTVVSAERRAKNILIHLDNGQTILIHMKMTGHLLYGTYRFDASLPKDPWQPVEPESLKDPFNRHVRFLISFDDGTSLALSDVRKFAKVTASPSAILHESEHLREIGPEPLDPDFTFEAFTTRIDKRPNGKIKQVLMDQSILAGIGNIYADESLWRASIHPLTQVKSVSTLQRRELFQAILQTLSRGIDFGGDSTSDYRNIDGEKGSFHEQHYAYRMTGTPCQKKDCIGTITRIVLGGRGTHFCSEHQKYVKKKAAHK